MATRAYYIGTEQTGDVLTTTNFNKLPQGWIAKASNSTVQDGPINSTSRIYLAGNGDSGRLQVTPTVQPNRLILVQWAITMGSDIPQATSPGGEQLIVFVYKDTTPIAETRHTFIGQGTEAKMTGFTFIPSGGTTESVSYFLQAGLSGPGASYHSVVGANDPAVFILTDVGPSS